MAILMVIILFVANFAWQSAKEARQAEADADADAEKNLAQTKFKELQVNYNLARVYEEKANALLDKSAQLKAGGNRVD